MRLIFIYGPPAAGKLTVGECLAARTGYKLFHNHLTVDLAHALFEFGSAPFGRYVEHLRFEAFETAARAGLAGMIFTFVYALGADDGFVRAVQEIIERFEGEVCFVQLVCDRAALEQRVQGASRQRFRKITDGALLRAVIGRHEVFQPIPFVSSLTIDTTELAAEEAAGRIAAHYGLPLVAPS